MCLPDPPVNLQLGKSLPVPSTVEVITNISGSRWWEPCFAYFNCCCPVSLATKTPHSPLHHFPASCNVPPTPTELASPLQCIVSVEGYFFWLKRLSLPALGEKSAEIPVLINWVFKSTEKVPESTGYGKWDFAEDYLSWALLPWRHRIRSSHFVKRAERGTSQNFTKGTGQLCPCQSGQVRSMILCNQTELPPLPPLAECSCL